MRVRSDKIDQRFPRYKHAIAKANVSEHSGVDVPANAPRAHSENARGVAKRDESRLRVDSMIFRPDSATSGHSVPLLPHMPYYSTLALECKSAER